MAAMLVAMLGLAYNDRTTAGDPEYVGTFTFTHCVESTPMRSCSPRGDWVSLDGDIRKSDVTLSGVLPSSGVVETLYKPTSYAPDTVHTLDARRMLPFAPWIAIVAILIASVVQARRWHLRDSGREH